MLIGVQPRATTPSTREKTFINRHQNSYDKTHTETVVRAADRLGSATTGGIRWYYYSKPTAHLPALAGESQNADWSAINTGEDISRDDSANKGLVSLNSLAVGRLERVTLTIYQTCPYKEKKKLSYSTGWDRCCKSSRFQIHRRGGAEQRRR